MEPKDKNENAKDPKRKTPMELPGVKPADYIKAAKGKSAENEK
jgi:hypothetical protein